MDKEMTIKTDLDTLSEAWNILDELGLSAALIPGNPVNANALELAGKLLKEKKLHQFVAVIGAGSIEAAGKLSLADAVEIIMAFFTSMASELASLAGIWNAMKTAPSSESEITPTGE